MSGKIITFYSYKGGTGRTMALANVAWILASRGKKILAVDWDLEAPGLHSYFRPFLRDRELTSPPGGVIDLVTEFAVEATTPEEDKERDPHWHLRLADIRRYAASLSWEFPGEGTIDFVSSGRQGPSYAPRVTSFDWYGFYSQLGGGVFLEAVRDGMRKHYDFTLIDSRTGVSDTGGICTVHLPDTLVLCFTMNNQSIDGAVAVAESIVEQRSEESFRIFPVPTRIEYGEAEKLERRRDYARRKCSPFMKHISARKHDSYWGDIEIPYRSFYAYEEVLAAFGDRPQVPGSLLASFERLTRHLTDGSVTSLAVIPKDQREKCLAAFEHEHESPAELSYGESPALDTDAEALWNVPVPRNPFFTGREEVLLQLHYALTKDGSSSVSKIQAICGLGGIGKSQIAAEYAYRYRNEYQAVFWVQAESETDVRNGFVTIAGLVDSQQETADGKDDAVRAVKCWMEENRNWLLIFDNADRPEIIPAFLPPVWKGHVVVTSRSQAFGNLRVAKPIFLEPLTPVAAVDFLMERAGRVADDPAEQEAAVELAEELGQLPLALEQAAAYIAERGARFRDYLQSFRKRGLELLTKSRPGFGEMELVSTVWSLNFEEVNKDSEASADILRVSAFLSPYDIPFEFLVEGAEELGPRLARALTGAQEDPLVLVDIFEPVTRYSLVLRNIENRSYSLHRLVQAVLRDEMSGDSSRLWAERAVRALNRVFPEVTFANWPKCERLFHHVQAAADLVAEFDFGSQEVGRLMNEAALYSKARARYDEAERLYKLSLKIFESSLGSEHASVATTLSNLASLYRAQGRLKEAEPLYRHALLSYERALGPEHPLVADNLNNLAVLFMVEGRLGEAEPLYRRALAIKERSLGPGHPSVADSLHNLAVLFRHEGRLEEAEPLYLRALEIKENALGPENPAIGATLNDLADLYRVLGRHAEAEPLYQRDLMISERALGPEHPDVGVTLNNLANLYFTLGRYAEAEPLYRRALAISEKVRGRDHPEVATVLTNLADLYRANGNLDQAEPLYRRSLKVLETVYGSEHASLIPSLKSYAALLADTGRTLEATELEGRAKSLQERERT